MAKKLNTQLRYSGLWAWIDDGVAAIGDVTLECTFGFTKILTTQQNL